ncbi:MAG: response regulator [Xanthomonadales bacterium]|nr:response regulator [Xanthomonadales bacterium]
MNQPSLTERETGERQPGVDAIRVLVVEDDPLDAELVLDRLAEDGLSVSAQVVDQREAYQAALDGFGPDIVLSDLSLPGFSGHEALALLRARDQRTPFVFVSGTLGEDVAIEALRGGATDYILKHAMARLAAAVRRAVAEAAERRARDQAEAELVRAQRFETLAILAGSLGHDLRNTLQPVLLAVDLIEGRVTEPEAVRMCALVRDCAWQGLEMVGRMMDLARGGERAGDGGQARTINVPAMLDAVAMLLRPSLPTRVELSVQSDDPGLALAGNSVELQQCLLNLALNAVQAMPEGGRLTLAARRFQPSPGFFDDAAPTAGAWLHLSVADTGTGMDADTVARLFTPFFTTKPTGNGLGLVSCRRFVDSHQGHIRVDSRPGGGTRFDLYLPLQRDTGSTAQDASTGAHDAVGGRVVIACSDEDLCRDLTDILELFGYQAVPPEQGEGAVAAMIEHDAGVVERVDSLRSAFPDLPLVLLAGSSRVVADPALGKVAAVLGAPLTAGAVVRALSAAGVAPTEPGAPPARNKENR